MPTLFSIETEKTALTWSGPNFEAEVTPTSYSEALGRLAIFPCRVGLEPRIVRSVEGIPPQVLEQISCQAGPLLYEETQYKLLIESKTQEEVDLEHRDPIILKNMNKLKGGRLLFGVVNFGGQIGRSRFKVLCGGRPEYDFEVEVFPGKLDYKEDYEYMLADLQDIITALVLEYLQSTFQFGFTQRDAVTTRLEWLLLLRSVFKDLERGLRYIERHPQREIARERLPTKVERLRRPDAAIIRSVMQGKGEGRKIYLRNGLPLRSRLPERRASHTLDTQEHRWIAGQLTQIRKRLAEIHDEEKRRIKESSPVAYTERKKKILDEIRDLMESVSLLENIEPIAAAKGQPTPGFASLKLQHAPGYREVYHACTKIRLGLRVGDGGLPLSVKHMHDLYEYWCFLSVVRMVSDILSLRVPVERLVKIDQRGVVVNLQKGRCLSVPFKVDESQIVEVIYNPIYNGESYVLPQQPDIMINLLRTGWPKMSLILDAKYRIDKSSAYVQQFGFPGPPRDAINVLHRYRDAIIEEIRGEESLMPDGDKETPREQSVPCEGIHADKVRAERFKRNVVEGVALYPYADRENEFINSKLWESLKRLGIGAIPFLPTEKKYVEEWLRSVLRQGGWSVAERAIPHVAHDRLRTWREASREVVLVGTLRREARSHLEWVVKNRFYYTPITHTQNLQFFARWLAIYSPSTLRKPGAVTHYAQVERIDVAKRKDIPTPWPAGEKGEQLQVVYHLGEVIKLDKAIENRGDNGRGFRFSRNRWTSLLALQRAKELRELFLETEPEWRFYDGAKAAGIDFTIYPGQPVLKGEGEPKGRAIFAIGVLRVQYKGSAGFAIKLPGDGTVYRRNAEEALDYVKQVLP